MKARTIRRRLNRERGGGREPLWRHAFQSLKRYRLDPQGEIGWLASTRILVTDLYAVSKDGDTYSWWEPADPRCGDVAEAMREVGRRVGH